MRLGYKRPLQATDLWKMDPSRECEWPLAEHRSMLLRVYVAPQLRLTSADHLSNRFLGYLHQSQTKADEWNRAHPDPRPKRRTRVGWKIKAATRRRLPPQYAKYGPDKSYRERVRTQAAHWKAHCKKHGNLALALFKTFPSYWYAGMFKVLADMTQLMSPLVIKALIRFSQQGE